MKVAILVVCAFVAYATAAPQKRLIIDDIAGEASKILKCEGATHEEGCRQCCEGTKWYFNTEKAACNAACNILPDKADYITTTDFPYSTFKPVSGGDNSGRVA